MLQQTGRATDGSLEPELLAARERRLGRAERAVAADRAGMTPFRDTASLRPARLLSHGVGPDLKAHGVTFMSASDSPRSSDFFDSAYGETPPWDIGAAQPDLIALFNEYPPAAPSSTSAAARATSP